MIKKCISLSNNSDVRWKEGMLIWGDHVVYP